MQAVQALPLPHQVMSSMLSATTSGGTRATSCTRSGDVNPHGMPCNRRVLRGTDLHKNQTLSITRRSLQRDLVLVPEGSHFLFFPPQTSNGDRELHGLRLSDLLVSFLSAKTCLKRPSLIERRTETASKHVLSRKRLHREYRTASAPLNRKRHNLQRQQNLRLRRGNQNCFLPPSCRDVPASEASADFISASAGFSKPDTKKRARLHCLVLDC